MRRTRRFLIASSLVIGALVAAVATPRVANAQEKEQQESYAMQANQGVRFGLAPALLLPIRSEGPYGAGVTLDGRYGFQLGPTVIGAGGRLGAYTISDRFVGVAMPTLRITVPVGPLAPFVMGGVGPGYVSNQGGGGAALLAGGGIMIHLGRSFGFGGEGMYQVVTGTAIKTWVIGPSMSIGG